MSPIFVRPVREQLEHDRLIRHSFKRNTSGSPRSLINVGEEQVTPSRSATGTFFPDLVLSDGKKLAGVVEVESGESVNNLEVMAQWVHFAKARVPFHLYVPVHWLRLRPTPVRSPQGACDGSLDLPARRRRLRSRADVARRGGGRCVRPRGRCRNRADAAGEGRGGGADGPCRQAGARARSPDRREASAPAKPGEEARAKPAKAAKPAAEGAGKATRAPAKGGQEAREEGQARLAQEVGPCRSSATPATSAATKARGHARLSVEVARGQAARECSISFDRRRI